MATFVVVGERDIEQVGVPPPPSPPPEGLGEGFELQEQFGDVD
jgi:hypothetical protein